MKVSAGLCAAALLAVPALFGHAVSLSTGELKIDGSRASYELRIPLYEAAHIRNPSREIFEHISFASSGGNAEAKNAACREETADGSYRCTATYEFQEVPAIVTARCTLASITVPNHVHVLKASKAGGIEDQAVFDVTFTEAKLEFQKPGALAGVYSDIVSGATRALAGWAQILFLAALVLAARSQKELGILTACFLAAQVLVASWIPHTAWTPAPRFIEAAAALSVAYLAAEILFFPAAGQRWAVVLILGAIHGLYFALLLRTTGFRPLPVLGGAAAAQIAALGAAALVAHSAERFASRAHFARAASWLLFVTGLGWFLIRLKS
jgi:hypothetical protein